MSLQPEFEALPLDVLHHQITVPIHLEEIDYRNDVGGAVIRLAAYLQTEIALRPAGPARPLGSKNLIATMLPR